MSDKTANYSDADTLRLIEMYETGGNDALESIAEAMGKTVRSVRSKLVREGVYVASAKPSARKVDTGPSKKELLNELENIVGFDVTGFTGATKPALESLINRLKA